MHTFDLNLDPVEEEEEEDEEGEKLSTEALGCCSSSRFIHINEGMDLNLPLGSDLYGGNTSINSLMELGESSSMRGGVELGCEEDKSNTNKELLLDLNVSLSDQELFEVSNEVVDQSNRYNNEIQFDLNDNLYQGDTMMVDSYDSSHNYNDEVDGEEALGMVDPYDSHHEVVEDVMELFGAAIEDGGDELTLPDYFLRDMVEGVLEQFWTDFATTFSDDDLTFYWSMPTSVSTVTFDVDNLPSVTLTQEELNKNNSVCAICMENFCIEEKLKRLPCFHYYHEGCISPWLKTTNTCPTCRYELPIM